jgi:hypothetical protein
VVCRSSTRAAFLLARVGFAALVALAACAGRGDDATVAVLVVAHANVEASHGEGGTWRPAAPGARFRIGDAIRTGAGASAKLELAGGGTVDLGANSLLRIEDRVAYRLAVGLAELEAGDEARELVTSEGRTRVEQRGTVRSESGAGQLRLTVVVGTARFATDQDPGARPALRAGEVLVAERGHVSVAAAGAVDAGVAPAADAAAAPALATASLVAGESPEVLESHPPARLAIVVDGRCAGEAIVEMQLAGRAGRLQARGRRRVIVELPAGRHAYEVRCAGADAVAAHGTITVRAPGEKRLPAAGAVAAAPTDSPAPAAHDTLDADGRRYRIVHGDLPPALTFTWAQALPAPSYRLHIEPQAGGAALELRTARPRRSLRPGELGVGSYRFWFETDGGRRSPRTSFTLAHQP